MKQTKQKERPVSTEPRGVRRKAARAASYQRGQERKAQRRQREERRAFDNRQRRIKGELTAHQVTYLERRTRRDMLAIIARNPCRHARCQRPAEHKGKHGAPTQTELANARKVADHVRASKARGPNIMPREVTWERVGRRLRMAFRHVGRLDI